MSLGFRFKIFSNSVLSDVESIKNHIVFNNLVADHYLNFSFTLSKLNIAIFSYKSIASGIDIITSLMLLSFSSNFLNIFFFIIYRHIHFFIVPPS